MREWKTIIYATKYEVSNYGEIRHIKKNKILKPYISKQNGYAYVTIVDDNGHFLNKRVHRIVAEMFIPNPYGLPMINHKDFNRTNNKVSNLEWVDGSQNNLWSRENISRSAKNKVISNATRKKFSQNQIAKSKNPYPTYIYKTKTGYIFRIIRQGKSIVSKQMPALQQVIAYKENWLKEHYEEIDL